MSLKKHMSQKLNFCMVAAAAMACLMQQGHAQPQGGGEFPHLETCSSVEPQDRVACGSEGISEGACRDRGCCWQRLDGDGGDRRRRRPSSPSCFKSPTDVRRIICPFLSTLVNEGALPVKDVYTREELSEVTVLAGLSEELTMPHVDGNFAHNPSGVQDIFNMEGAANEHVTSTGVHDCATFYHHCSVDAAGVGTCSNSTRDCAVPNLDRFTDFFQSTDTNNDGFISREELVELSQGFPFMVDANPLPVGGTIEGSHQFILEVFGEDNGARISRESLRRVFIDRRYPDGYVFPKHAISSTSTSTSSSTSTFIAQV